jgi:hypothetical protein
VAGRLVEFEERLGRWRLSSGGSESTLLLPSVVLADKGNENNSDKGVQELKSS